LILHRMWTSPCHRFLLLPPNDPVSFLPHERSPAATS
jgi:hypothetical protein